jgi:hypothetical protein
MTETLERTDVFEIAFVVIDVDDYLDVRQPGWALLEKPGAVEARDGKVHVNPDLFEVLSAMSRAFPAKCPPHAQPI